MAPLAELAPFSGWLIKTQEISHAQLGSSDYLAALPYSFLRDVPLSAILPGHLIAVVTFNNLHHACR